MGDRQVFPMQMNSARIFSTRAIVVITRIPAGDDRTDAIGEVGSVDSPEGPFPLVLNDLPD